MSDARLASEIVGFAMIFALISAVGVSLLYFVGVETDSTSRTSESIVRQKISQIDESLRVIRTYETLQDDGRSWGVEVVNNGLVEIHVVRIHYLMGDRVVSSEGCGTTSAEGDGSPCVIEIGVITHMRLAPDPAGTSAGPVKIIAETLSGNTFVLVSDR